MEVIIKNRKENGLCGRLNSHSKKKEELQKTTLKIVEETKKILFLKRKLICKKRKGMSRKKWTSNTEEDLTTIKNRKWKEETSDKKKWREIVQEILKKRW